MKILKSAREKVVLKQGLLVIGVMAILYIFLLNPFLKEGSSMLEDELGRKTSDIKRYIKRTGALPSKESFDKLEKDRQGLEKTLQELVDFVDPEKVRISESSTEAGLYFIERLHSSIKKFSEKAVLKDTELPEDLGFGGGLPKEGVVGILLRQLETVELAVDTLLESETIEFSTIKPLKSIDYIESLSKKIFYSELPVQISIKTDTDSLIDFLLELKNRSPVISVKEVHIKSSEFDTANIEASLVLSTFMLVKGTE